MGEGFGVYKIGNDDALLKIVRSANVACGFHAGDPNVMHNGILTSFDSRDDLIWTGGRGEGGEDSIALVVRGHGAQTSLLLERTGWIRSSAWINLKQKRTQLGQFLNKYGHPNDDMF